MPPFFIFTREPVTRATADGEVRLVADQHHLAAARGQLQGVEVSAGEASILLDPAIKGGAGQLGGPLGADLRARQANVQTPHREP